MKIIAVLAMTPERLIGKNGKLPWYIPEDLEHFKKITSWGIVVMGRSTYESLPSPVRPLPGRRNIVLSRSTYSECESYQSIDELISELQYEEISEIYLIWWAKIYSQFFENNLVDEVQCTLIEWDYSGDTFLSEWRDNFTLENSRNFSKGKFQVYQKKIQEDI
jgi:dihydrofolate reductase